MLGSQLFCNFVRGWVLCLSCNSVPAHLHGAISLVVEVGPHIGLPRHAWWSVDCGATRIVTYVETSTVAMAAVISPGNMLVQCCGVLVLTVLCVCIRPCSNHVCQVYQHRFNMSDFGCTSRKPTHLMSNASWVVDIPPGPFRGRPLAPSVTTRRYTDRSGRLRCVGTRFLKATQLWS